MSHGSLGAGLDFIVGVEPSLETTQITDLVVVGIRLFLGTAGGPAPSVAVREIGGKQSHTPRVDIRCHTRHVP